MAAPRSEEIKVRVTAPMKAEILRIAESRGEAESVIVREALVAYLKQARTYPVPIPADPQLNEPAPPAVSAPLQAPAAPTAAQLLADAARSRALGQCRRPLA